MGFFKHKKAQVFDCAKLAAEIKEDIKKEMVDDQVYCLNIFAPNTPENQSYIKGLKKDAVELGIEVCERSTTNWGWYVHDDPYIVMYEREEKEDNYDELYDIDCRNKEYSEWYATTGEAVYEILHELKEDADFIGAWCGKHIVVIGRGETGNGIYEVLRDNTNATVSQCNRWSQRDFCKTADVIISATGQPCTVGKCMVKKGAIVIDVGVSVVDGKVVGDVSEDVKEKASWVTTVPKGVGLVTRALLLQKVVRATNEARD